MDLNQNFILTFLNMTEEKWEQVVGQIKDSFDIESHETEEGDLDGESFEVLIFTNPLGRMRLVRQTKPRLLETKTLYSNRKGATGTEERVYSDTETVDMVRLYREVGGDWEEIDASALG